MEQNIEISKMKVIFNNFTLKQFLIRENIIMITISLLIGYGIWETVLGWEQLIGFKLSHHYLFPVTGSFYNPGPYCLFLGIIIPLALNNIIKYKRGIFYWEGLIYIILTFSLMPILLGRTGWIATIVGVIVTAFGTGHLKMPHKKKLFLFITFLVFAILIIFYILYKLKPASALGRFFLWGMGMSALMVEPLNGVGWNHVPGVLGFVQENYFSQNQESNFIKVAGSPECAFNEYLQIGIAFGIPALILFILILGYSAYSSWKGKEYGLTGSIVAIAIGCIGSYPFRFYEFIILAGVLIIIGILSFKSNTKYLFFRICLSIGIFFICLISLQGIRHSELIENDWKLKRYAYQYTLSSKSIDFLNSLMIVQKDNPTFLFDYGKALRETKLYDKSNAVLKKGLDVSSDPMFLNLIGKNYQDLGYHEIAEEYYKRSINRLPGRLYPYYLLAKLYSDPLFLNKNKFLEIYNKAMVMEPKVMSPAINDMRNELRETFAMIQTTQPLDSLGQKFSYIK